MSENLNDGYDQPHRVDDIQAAFAADLGELLPPWDLIPETFRSHHDTDETRPWKTFQADWFFKGTRPDVLTPHEGVDPDKALRHLATIQKSFEPKHEHKEAAVAWLASRWFSAVSS